MSSQAHRQIKSIVGANIRAGRDALGLNQRQLAQALDTDVMNVSRWERGKVMPGLENLQKLSGVLGQDLGWFYVDRDEVAA
jgi:transcriptional regulator with XRE-family HTH domain